MKGILARKIGMTRFISPETGEMSAVTVLQAAENTVVRVKKTEKDGYDAVVLGLGKKTKKGNAQWKYQKELRLSEGSEWKTGDTITLDSLQDVPAVTIQSVCKGRGFSGVIKRHNFSRGRETHGSHHHREPGSVGMCAKPGRILRGKKMPGQYGHQQVTLRDIPVLYVDTKNNIIAVKGPVPGAKKNFVFLYTS